MIAQRAIHWGMTISEDDVVITSGATEAVHLSLLATTRPGDVVAMETPAYYGTLQVAEALGLKVLGIPCHPATGLDVDALAERLDQLTVAAVVATPSYSNPLAAACPTMSRERRRPPLLPRRAAHRGRRLRRARLRAGPRPAGQGRDSRRLGAPLLLLHQDPGAGLPHRLRGAGGAPPRAGRAAQVRHQRRLADAPAAGAGPLPLRRRLRPPPADAAGPPGRHRGEHRLGGGAPLPGGHPGLQRRAAAASSGSSSPEGLDAMALHARALDVGVAISPGPIFSPQGGHRSCIRLSCGLPWTGEVEAAVKLVGRLAGQLLRGAAESPFDERRD